MGVYIKNGSGDIKKLAGYVTVRQNARWFLCTRTIEDNVEYYTVPKEAETYFKSINAYTIYSLGFNESNTTNTPKLRYGTTVLDIKDFSNQAGEVMVGQLNGVFQMFTQDLATDPKIYFVANTHKDEYDTEMSDTSTNAVQNKVIKAYADNIGTLAEAIRDNTTQIIPKSGGLAIYGASKSAYTGSIAIGVKAYSNSSGTISVGTNAKSISDNAIQLGTGINSTQNSFQIRDDNIYKHDTHTATFQNLQIGGVDEYPTLLGADAPTTTTVGKVKQFYVETTTPALYYCSSITGTGTTEDPYVYNWTQAGGDETLAKQIQDNTTQIVATSSKGLLIGGALGGVHKTDIVIGSYAQISGSNNGSVVIGAGASSTNYGGDGTAIGSHAKSGGANAIALGYGAIANAQECVQIGYGTNSTNKSVQIAGDNIYKTNTHTLTVQNAQVNGNNVYGVLQGETDPTEATVGAVGQFYLNTASKALWQCVTITTTTDATTYTWQQVGGSSEKKYLHIINFWVTSPYNFGGGNYHLEIISSIKDPIGANASDLAKFLYDNNYRSAWIDSSKPNSKGPCIVSNRFAAVSTDEGSALARTIGLYSQYHTTYETYILYATTDLIQGNKATIKINNNSYDMLQSLYDSGSTGVNITSQLRDNISDTVVEL